MLGLEMYRLKMITRARSINDRILGFILTCCNVILDYIHASHPKEPIIAWRTYSVRVVVCNTTEASPRADHQVTDIIKSGH